MRKPVFDVFDRSDKSFQGDTSVGVIVLCLGVNFFVLCLHLMYICFHILVTLR